MKAKKLKQQITDLQAKLDATEKKAENSELHRGWAQRDKEKAEAELASIHTTLDGIELAPGRTVPDENAYGGKSDLNAAARFTGFIAALIHRQFKPQAGE